MSVAEMSATLQNKIATAIETALTKNGRLQLTERNQKAHLEFSSQDRIRADTNPGNAKHESIMSRGALTKLKTDLSTYITKNNISSLSQEIIDNLDFAAFIEFMQTRYFAGKELVDSASRKDPNFTYTQPIRAAGSKTRLIVGTNAGDSSRDVIVLKNIPHGTLVTYFIEYISETASISGKDKNQVLSDLKHVFNAGHLTGVFNARIIRAFGVRRDKTTGSLTVGGSSDQELVSVIQSVLDLTASADLLSSNIYDDPVLFLRTEKRLTDNSQELRMTTEVQFGRSIDGEKANQEVGQLLSTAGRYLSDAIKAVRFDSSRNSRDKAAGTATKKLFDSLSKIDKYIKDRVGFLKTTGGATIDPKLQQAIDKATNATKVYEALVASGGSDPILTHLVKAATSPLTGISKSALTDQSTAEVKKTLSKLNPKKKTGSGSSKNALKQNVTKLILKIKDEQIQQKLSNISNLEALLNAGLYDQIKRNMGTGNSKDVLNYRSGRFARSVKIERLSESRQGMITAFYSYMKNPYATFSRGGRQERPYTRDPKLLISKSIRELAGAQVANRMRAVLV
jgi:hypothetical protein